MTEERIKKGVILAGGTGSRLYPITHTGPKQLVPVGNVPILRHVIEDMVEAGIEEIGIILGTHGRDEIQQNIGDGRDLNADITYIIQGEPLGLAHAVGCAKDFVEDDPFVVYLGDNIMREGITELVDSFDPAEHAAAIGLQEVEDPTRYGVVALDGDEIVGFEEKPDDPPSNLALIGVYIFTPKIFEFIEGLEPSWRGELEISDAIHHLLESGNKVQSHTVEGWWKDTGRPADVLEANRLVLDDMKETVVRGTIEDENSVTGYIELGEGSVIEAGAVVRGPVSIGENTTIGGDSYVGPYTSIGDDSDIRKVHIESSVVIGESEINCDRTIVDSLMGKQTRIGMNKDKKPVGDRLIISQNSELHL